MKKVSTDIIVIGGGPAGMAAALKADEMGAKVLLVDRLPELGGILQQCIHNGFGLQVLEKDWTGPEYADHYIKKIGQSGIEVLLHTMAVEISKTGKVILSNDTDGLIEVNPKAIVLAMGCRERTRQQVSIPGTRPAGIFTAGVAQRFMNLEGYMPGKEIVVVGSGDIGLIMARRMTLEGAKVHAVTEIRPYPSGLNRNIVQCLHDYGIPLHLRHNVIDIYGKERVEGVKIAKLDDSGKLTNEQFEIECDTLLFSVGLIPENELSRMVQLEINPSTGGPFIDDAYQTDHEGIFICGNAAFVNDLADYATIEGEIAGVSAAQFAKGSRPKGFKVKIVAGDNIRFIAPNFITRTDGVILYMRVTEPLLNATIASSGDIIKIKKQIVKPSEMIEIKLDGEKLAKIKELKELRIDVRKYK
ncbi:NAD(P)/FAD-dependent oxidoreductase [Candidatus Margulisiibacteriota bacterium]